MLNETLLHQIRDTGELLGLDEAVIEKDYYVTQVIHALSNVENEYFRLVFCGGTCLAKAHKLVGRMSEDVDFKIQLKNGENFSRSRLNKELKIFRDIIKSSLTLPELTVIKDIARNEGKYQQIVMQYPQVFQLSQTLRPDMMLEFTYSNIRLPINELSVKTIIEDSLKEVNLFTPPMTKCISTEETAAEKWVGLTRRVMAIERERESDDNTLIRHVYDLCAINQTGKADATFINLVKDVISCDANVFKNQHPEYVADPRAEIKQSLNLLKNKSLWKERYEEFLETMVYDITDTLPYNAAMERLEHISVGIINSLTK